jgi:hypothetical protein
MNLLSEEMRQVAEFWRNHMANKYQSPEVYCGLIAALMLWGIVYISAGPGASNSSHLFPQRTSSSVASSPQFTTYFGGS